MKIGFLLFDGVTQLDFTGPLQFMNRMHDADIQIIAPSLSPVSTDSVLKLVPTHTLETADQLDLLCVPGGHGVAPALANQALIGFIAEQAQGLSHISSVCTGAFLLGAAGQLKNRKATTHWRYHHLLPRMGAIPVAARVIEDGPLITGGGVTAGIDFALSLIARINGQDHADRLALSLEYDPASPAAPGHPQNASAATLAAVETYYEPHIARFTAALDTITL